MTSRAFVAAISVSRGDDERITTANETNPVFLPTKPLQQLKARHGRHLQSKSMSAGIGCIASTSKSARAGQISGGFLTVAHNVKERSGFPLSARHGASGRHQLRRLRRTEPSSCPE